MDTLQFKIDIVGTSEEVKELGRLDQEIQGVNAQMKAYQNLIKGGAKDSAAYATEVAKLQLQTKALKDEKKALEKQTRAVSTEFKGQVGSMVRMNQELGNLRDEYRALSQAERENVQVGGALLAQIKAKDAELKKLDAELGNHQRSVGDYNSVWKGAQGILMKVTGALAAAHGAIEVGKAVINSAQVTADAWAESLSGAEFGLKALYKTIASGDYSNFIDNILLAIEVGREYARVLDDLGDRNRAYAIRAAEVEVEIEKLERISKNEMLTEQERIAAAERANEIEMQLAKDRQENANRLFEAEKNNLIALSGLSEEQLLNFVKQYDRTEELRIQAEEYNKALDDVIKTQKAAEGGRLSTTEISSTYGESVRIIREASEGVKMYGDVLRKVGKTTDEELDNLTDAWAAVYEVQSGVLQATEMGATRISTLQKRLVKDQETDLKKGSGETETLIKRLADLSVKNQETIITLSAKYIDAQISLMAEGVEKQQALENDRFNDVKAGLERENTARIEAIDKQIAEVEKRGPKATQAELAMVEKLQAEKLNLLENTNALIEIEEKVHQDKLGQVLRTATDKDLKAYMEALDKKSEAFAKAQAEVERRAKEGNKAILAQYDEEIQKIERNANLQIAIVTKYYKQKGTLTKKEENELANAIRRIQLETSQQAYNLLMAELKARQTVSDLSIEEIQRYQNELAKLYGQIKVLQGEIQGSKGDAGTTPKEKGLTPGVDVGLISGGLANLLGIDDEAADLILQKTMEIGLAVLDLWTNIQQQKIQKELAAEKKKLDSQQKSELKSLEQRRKKGLITEQQYEEGKEAIDAKYEKKKLELEKQAFERNKKLQLVNAVMGLAVAAINAMNMYPFIPMGLISLAAALVLGGLQIATIASSKFEAAEGGLIEGPSHKQGGVPIEVEGGEYIIRKEVVQSDTPVTVTGKPYEIFDYLNTRHKYASGGFVIPTPAPTPVRNTRVDVAGLIDYTLLAKEIARESAAVYNDKRVVISAVEMIDAQDNLKKIDIERTW